MQGEKKQYEDVKKLDRLIVKKTKENEVLQKLMNELSKDSRLESEKKNKKAK